MLNLSNWSYPGLDGSLATMIGGSHVASYPARKKSGMRSSTCSHEFSNHCKMTSSAVAEGTPPALSARIAATVSRDREVVQAVFFSCIHCSPFESVRHRHRPGWPECSVPVQSCL